MSGMTKGEREELKRLARERARVAKADAASRSADLKAMFEQQVATIYEYDRDEVWEAAMEEARKSVEEAQQIVADRCEALGIPREMSPQIGFGWLGRGAHAVSQRQSELRRAAYTRIDAMERGARHEIDRATLAIQTQLVSAGITSEAGIAFLAEMPKVEELMPPLDIHEITGGSNA